MKMECKIYYDAEFIDTKLDQALENTLKEFGYTRYASGYNHEEETRDLAFEKESK